MRQERVALESELQLQEVDRDLSGESQLYSVYEVEDVEGASQQELKEEVSKGLYWLDKSCMVKKTPLKVLDLRLEDRPQQ